MFCPPAAAFSSLIPVLGEVKPSRNPGFSCSSSTFAVRTENKAGLSEKLRIPRRLVGSCNPQPPAGESSLKGFRAWVFVSGSPLLGIGGFGDVKILITSPGEESGWASPLTRVERSPSQQIFISGVLLQHSLKNFTEVIRLLRDSVTFRSRDAPEAHGPAQITAIPGSGAALGLSKPIHSCNAPRGCFLTCSFIKHQTNAAEPPSTARVCVFPPRILHPDPG